MKKKQQVEEKVEIMFNNMTEFEIKKVCFLYFLEIAKNNMLKNTHKNDQAKKLKKYEIIKNEYKEEFADDTINDIESMFNW